MARSDPPIASAKASTTTSRPWPSIRTSRKRGRASPGCKALIFTNSVADPALARGALGAARRLIELAPDKPDGEMALGTYLRVVEGNQTLALEAYRRAEKLAPGTPDPLRSLGRAETTMGRWQDAIGHYDEAGAPGSEERDQRRKFRASPSRTFGAAARREGPSTAPSPSLPTIFPAFSRRRPSFSATANVRREPSSRTPPAESVPRRLPHFSPAGQEWLFDAETFALLRRLTPAAFDNQKAVWANAQAGAAWRAGDTAAARTYAEKAIPYYEELARSSPKYPGPHLVLGPLFAFAGKKAEAVREAVRATELDPVATSPWSGAEALANLAQTYVIAERPTRPSTCSSGC